MARGSRRILHAIVLVSATAGLGACQTTDVKPQVQAAAPAPVMDSDIQKILVAGGLNANAPGSLQTAKMPAEVQQAVAALQGNAVPAAAAVPGAAPGVTQVAAVEPGSPSPLVTPVSAKPASPPMLAALQATSGRGRKARGAQPQPQYALAPVPPQAASAPPQMAPQQVASNENLSQVRSYLPALPPQSQTIVLTGPNAHPRYSAGAGNSGGGVAVPSARATQAAVRVMQAPAAPAAPVVRAAAPEPEGPRVRRF